MELVESALRLRDQLRQIRFSDPVSVVYQPLEYAWDAHRAYLERYGSGNKAVLMVGMNPGPWGMVQTGVPFGDVEMVKTWLALDGCVGQPVVRHPKRPVLGFACTRREGSGRRLWTWARDRCGSPEVFFRRFFIGNYCPLCFFSDSGSNLTPDKLPPEQRRQLTEACDAALIRTVDTLRPQWVLGIGRFAEGRARQALAQTGVRVGGLPHPSPASPAANRGWAALADAALNSLEIPIP